MDRHSDELIENRLQEDRRFDQRTAQIRKMLKMQYQDKLHVDPSSIPENMDYMWVRESVLGDPALSKLSERRKVGWVPVPSQNHPEMMPDFDTGRKHHLDGYIHVSGLVLCQRPKEIGNVQREMEHESSIERMNSIPGQDGYGNGMPLKVVKNEVGISKMQSFKD